MKKYLAQHLAVQSGFRLSLAALFAFAFADYFDLTFGYWAVISVVAVMQCTISLTLRKSFLRLLGTLLGLLIAYLAVIMMRTFPYALGLIFFCGMFFISLLIFAKKEWAYLGIVCGITFIFITVMQHQQPHQLTALLIFRTVDILVGIVIAAACAYVIFPRRDSSIIKQLAIPVKWHPKAALMMASATWVSLVPCFFWHYPGGFWAPIACLFIIEESIGKTAKKALARFFAHLVVILIALLFSFLFSSVYGIAFALFIGMFFFGMWMEKPLFGFEGALANTMAIAYCVVLLLAPSEAGVYSTMASRLLNTSFGILCGILVVNLIQRHFPTFGKGH